MRLIEPLALLRGPAARDAVAQGLALPLASWGAFSLARLIETDGASRIVRATDLPSDWGEEVARLSAPVPDWAGFGPRCLVMGIVNVTPDSFSDGGLHLDPDRAIAAGRAMLAAGADLLDVGGESTRPGAAPVTPEEEQARILPVIAGLREAGAVISVDTRHAATMEAAVRAGAAIVNDVSALSHDPAALATVARLGCPVILMHMRGVPATMNTLAAYDDVAAEVTRELAARVAAAEAAGIPPDRIVVDPGIGFAKRGVHNHEMLRRLPLLLNLGCRVLAAASRKLFISTLSGAEDPRRRGPGTLAAHLFALERGASLLRVHDVADTVQAVQVWEALAG